MSRHHATHVPYSPCRFVRRCSLVLADSGISQKLGETRAVLDLAVLMMDGIAVMLDRLRGQRRETLFRADITFRVTGGQEERCVHSHAAENDSGNNDVKPSAQQVLARSVPRGVGRNMGLDVRAWRGVSRQRQVDGWRS